MNLAELTGNLTTIETVTELDSFVSRFDAQITLALLHLDASIPKNVELLDGACNAFYSSGVGRGVDERGDYSAGVHHILQLLGMTYERIGHSNIRRIAADIQDISLSKRLKALYAIRHETGFGRRGFIDEFPNVMRFLTEARYDPSDTSIDYTGNVLRILHLFKTLGDEHFRKHPASALAEFDNLFTSSVNLILWPLLAEYAEPVVSLPDIAGPFDFSKAVALPVEPSELFEALFEKVVTQPLRKKSPKGQLGSPFGYDMDYGKNYIIENGTADFRKPFTTSKGEILSPSDRALLYCHYNLRVHYFSSYYVYSVYLNAFNQDRLGFSEKLFFLDLGCGPLTSGLAIADLFLQQYKTPINMCYIGVDIAPAMLEKAVEFQNNAPALFANSEFYFIETFVEALELITNKLVMYNHTIVVNTSYLFASSSLKIVDLAAFITRIRAVCVQASINIVFQNPDRKDRNINYVAWKRELELSGLETVARHIFPISYRNRIGEPERHSKDIYYELLSY